MRLFTAIDLPQVVRDYVGGICGAWAKVRTLRDVTWVADQNLHITLKFLGELADERVAELCQSLRAIEPTGEALLWTDRLELFPLRGPVRVIALGLGSDSGKLQTLYRQIEAVAERFDIPREDRKYQPHITMGRARPPLEPHRRLGLIGAASDLLSGPQFNAAEFTLMQSVLKPEGPQYSPIARFPL